MTIANGSRNPAAPTTDGRLILDFGTSVDNRLMIKLFFPNVAQRLSTVARGAAKSNQNQNTPEGSMVGIL